MRLSGNKKKGGGFLIRRPKLCHVRNFPDQVLEIGGDTDEYLTTKAVINLRERIAVAEWRR